MITKRFSILAACALLIIFAALSLSSALRESLTYDEIVAMEVGNDAWQRRDFFRDPYVPPFMREIVTLPSNLGFVVNSPYPNIRELPGRSVIIALGVLLGFAIYIISQLYFGSEVALLALFLYVFEPNILANSHYITQDIGVTLFFFLAYFSLAGTFKKPSWRNFLGNGLFVGLMASSKIPALPFYFVSTFLLTVFSLRQHVYTWFWKYKLRISLSIVLSLFVIWSTYFFRTNVIIASGGNTERLSVKVANWAAQNNNQMAKDVLTSLHTVQVPLGDYIAVLKNSALRFTKHKSTFFLGTFYTNTKWYFMPVNVFLKTPLTLAFIFLFGFLINYRNKKVRSTMVTLLIPVISVLFVSSVTKMQPLVRYVLPIYPFIIIIAASAMLWIKEGNKKLLLFLLCVWYAWGSLSSFPHFIGYTNEIAGPKEKSYMKFMDSNMDWGQSLISFKRYVDMVKTSRISFSYFGRDDAAAYGFPSDFLFGSYKFNEICAFHDIDYPSYEGSEITAISLSNWYYCGYYLDPLFEENKVNNIIGRSILVFK